MKFRYLYKIYLTKGKLQGCYYYGQHTTNNLFDNYKGSGRIITDYYKKYPNDYNKIILGFYNTREDLDKAEREIIKLHKKEDKCINIQSGGHNGYYCKDPKQKSKKLSKALKGKPNKNKGKPMSEISKEHVSEGVKRFINKDPDRYKELCAKGGHAGKGKKRSQQARNNMSIAFKNRKLTEDTKHKISETLKKIGQTKEYKEKARKGGLNTIGRIFIYKDKVNKRVKPEEIDYYINLGWTKGRYKTW